jgi:carbon monoxide dehydrogenase subunit G
MKVDLTLSPLLLGPWNDQTFKMDLAATPVKTRPQSMVIEITGDRQMAENLARQIKIDLLKKQM